MSKSFVKEVHHTCDVKGDTAPRGWGAPGRRAGAGRVTRVTRVTVQNCYEGSKTFLDLP